MTLTLVIPGIPPDLNHYVRHTRFGRHYVTKEAKAFKELLAYLLRDRHVIGKAFEVEALIWMGAGKKGDVDGFSKLILDGLAAAGAFRSPKLEPMSDAHVTDLIMRKRRDRANPRTEVTIRALE